MAADYEPGIVAVATVRGVEGVRVFRTLSKNGGVWRHTQVSGHWCSHDEDITDVRPLVVLDVDDLYGGDDMGGWGYVVETLRKEVHATGTRLAIADQIEAQTKPPRIPEPGLWGVVEARWPSSSERFTFVHTNTSDDCPWQVTEDGSFAAWDDLIDPTLIREGVAS